MGFVLFFFRGEGWEDDDRKLRHENRTDPYLTLDIKAHNVMLGTAVGIL